MQAKGGIGKAEDQGKVYQEETGNGAVGTDKAHSDGGAKETIGARVAGQDPCGDRATDKEKVKVVLNQ